MNSFGLALASIALVLVNMGIGWTLAKYHSRLRPPPPEPPLPGPPGTPEVDPAVVTANYTAEEIALSDELEPLLPEFAMRDSDDPSALATSAPLEYYS